MGVSVVFVTILIVQTVAARPSSEFKMMIFPLECSIDMLHTGVTTFRQITPENCQDPDEEPGIPGDTGQSPIPSEQPQRPSSVWYGNISSPLEQMPITVLPESHEVKKTISADPPHDHAANETSTSRQMQIMTAIIVALPLLALLFGLVHLFLVKIGRR